MLTIFAVPTLNSIKVVLTAEQLGLDYQLITPDFAKQEHKTPQHLARHPLGKVPVIEHDGKTLFESNAISIYLADVSESELYPADPHHRGQVHQWIDLMSFHPGRWLAAHYFEYFIKPKFLGGSADPEALKEADAFLEQQLPVVENQLSTHPWIAGDQQTVADLVAFAFFHTHEFSEYSFSKYGAITTWYIRIRSSAAFVRTAQRLGLPA